MQRTLIKRLGHSYMLFLAMFFMMQSTWLATLLGYPYIGPVGFNNFALLLPLIGIALFLYVERRELLSPISLAWPSAIDFSIRCIVCIVVVGISAWITHPSYNRFLLMQIFMKKYAPMAEPLIATGLYASLFLPLFPLIILFLPLSFLRRYITLILNGILLLFLFIFSHPFEAFYHIVTGPTLLRIVGNILQMLPGNTVLSPQRWEVQYRGFSIILGPLCSGFTAMSLFIVIFCLLWYLASKQGGIHHLRATIALIVGTLFFFLLNILRIVLIIVIGSFSHFLGVVLFHGMAGSLFFFLVIVVTIRSVLPKIRKRQS